MPGQTSTRVGPRDLSCLEREGGEARPEDVLAGPQIGEESSPRLIVDRREAGERRREGRMAVVDPTPSLVGQANAQRSALIRPDVDEVSSLELPNQMVGGLSSDEEEPPDGPRMQLLLVVQELHHLELRERDGQLHECICEPGP